MHRVRAAQQHPRRQPQLARGLAAGLLAAGCAVLAGAGPAAAAAGPQLTTDSGGAPLLTGGGLAPGRTVENCLLLTYQNLPLGTNGIGMYAAVAGTGLADYLDLTISIGTGGGFGNCSGFVGAPVYSGSLAAFGQAHVAPASQLLVGTVGQATGNATIRVRVRLRDNNGAQGRSASAIFSWTAGAVTLPPPGASPSPSTSPATSARPTTSGSAAVTSSPAPSQSASQGPASSATPAAATSSAAGAPDPAAGPTADPVGGDAAPTQPTTPVATTRAPPQFTQVGPPLTSVTVPLLPTGPGRFPSTKPAGQPPENRLGDSSSKASNPGAAAQSPAGAAEQIRDAIAQLITTAQQVVPEAAKGGALGLGTLPFVLLFLIIQKRLDERDPKLALAPSYEDDFLSFEDPAPSRPDAGLR